MKKQGVTFIELLLVITIVGILFSLSIPVSYSMYERYKISMEAERLLTFIANQRLESFLYGEEKVLSSKEGKLLLNGETLFGNEKLFVYIERPITFYTTGTTSGGKIKMYARNLSFIIEVSAPFGGLTLKRD